MSTSLPITFCYPNLLMVKYILVVKSRDVFERAVEFYGEENMDEKIFVAFARFEEACKEVKGVIERSFIQTTLLKSYHPEASQSLL